MTWRQAITRTEGEFSSTIGNKLRLTWNQNAEGLFQDNALENAVHQLHDAQIAVRFVVGRLLYNAIQRINGVIVFWHVDPTTYAYICSQLRNLL